MKMLLNGRWVDRAQRLEVRDPQDGSLVDTVPLASAEEARRLNGETISFDQMPGSENRLGYFSREPIGVVGAITPEAIMGKVGLKKVGMELGSNCPVIVMADADLELAAAATVSGAFWAAGQNCLHVQRLLVQDAVYDDFVARFVASAKAVRTGDKLDEATDMGPLINEAAARRLACGGVMVNDSTDYRIDAMPFGGVKGSGLGREGIRFALQEMTEPKLVCFNL